MRIACIIMAHKEPQQIERFIKKFSQFPFDFYIHLDKKISQAPFEYLAELPQVYFITERIRVRWASYSFLYAVLHVFKEVLGKGQYDFISFMSGQDYPIKPVTDFYQMIEKNTGKNFISYEEGANGGAMPSPELINIISPISDFAEDTEYSFF